MTDNEVDKIIAEYMGLRFYEEDVFNQQDASVQGLLKPYTKSLDALVPVWEKPDIHLEISFEYCPQATEKWKSVVIAGATGQSFRGSGKTLASSAAYSTAKAIQEITKEVE